MNKNLVIPIIIMLLVLFTTGCYYDPAKDQEIRYPRFAVYHDIRPYTYDPKTILTALDRGEGQVFQSLPDWGQERIYPPGSFAWPQQDYLKITSALNKVVTEDNLEGWSVYSINASRDCADTPLGFDNFAITYFKTVGDRYTTREMNVRALAKEADWAGNMDFPRPFPFGWASIDLEKLKVTADDALQIAEVNGGKAARQAVNNACSIAVALAPNADDVNWGIYYFGGAATLFHFSVYPY